MNLQRLFPDGEVFRRSGAVIVVVLWLVAVLIPVGDRGLWAPDEPRYVQVAWSMDETGSWLIPVINGELYTHKPPLYFWLTSLAARMSDYERSSRYVTATAVLLLLYILFGFETLSERRGTGLTASLVLMSSGLFTWLMGTGNIDVLLAFWIAAACYAFMQYRRCGRRSWIVTSYVICGLGILTKGPVGWLVPYLIFIVWTVLDRRSRGSETPPAKHLAWGPLLALAVAAAWVVPACLSGGADYTRMILFKQNIGRAVASFAHRKPFYYYLEQLPVLMLPWSVVLLGLIPEFRRRWRERDPWIRFYGVWILVIVVFFSLISGKRGRYMIPAFPAFALLAADLLETARNRSVRYGLTAAGIIVLLAALILAVAPVFAPLAGNMIAEKGLPPVDTMGMRRLAAAMTALAGAMTAVWVIRGRWASYRQGAIGLALSVLMLLGSAHVWIIPYLDPVKSAKAMAERIRREVGPGGRVALIGSRFDGGLNVYLDKVVIPVVPLDELAQNRDWDLFVVREKDYHKVEKILGADRMEEIDAARTGSHHFKLIRPRVP